MSVKLDYSVNVLIKKQKTEQAKTSAAQLSSKTMMIIISTAVKPFHLTKKFIKFNHIMI